MGNAAAGQHIFQCVKTEADVCRFVGVRTDGNHFTPQLDKAFDNIRMGIGMAQPAA